MNGWYGDYAEDSTVYIPWSTNGANGAAITRDTDGNIRIYKNNSATQKTTTNGITDTEDFDSVTGCHMLAIDTSNDTGDSGFWATGNDYHVMLEGASIDSQTVNVWLGSFSIENRGIWTIKESTDLITSANVNVINAISSGTITVKKGDSYNTTIGQTITVTKPSGASWPTDLSASGVTLTFTARKKSSNSNTGDAELSSTNITVTQATGSAQAFTIDLTSTDTDGLAIGANGYSYDVQYKSGSERNTLISGDMTVIDEMTTTDEE